MQLLFMSDVLTASGNKISLEVLSCCPRGEAWSRMQWPNKQPTTSDMELWKNAMHSICPSQCSNTGVGRFIWLTHRVWKWYWNTDESTLHRTNGNGSSEDVFVAGRKPNHFHYSHSQSREHLNRVCLVQPTLEGEHWRLLSTAQTADVNPTPTMFLKVLESWGNTWLWENMSVSGGMKWIHQSILDGSLVAVTDGSCIREFPPHLCSAAFVLECGKGQGRVIGSFSKSLAIANAYQGELLGLMAIHLLLLSVNKIHQTLEGSVEIVLDCLGALNCVSYLPPYRIPLRCWHSDIIKNILVHCRDLSFVTYYSHIKVHQDDQTSFQNLSRKAQLNCICDHAAQFRIAKDGTKKSEPGKMFPLESVGVFVQGEKMMSDTGGHIRYRVHHQLVRTYYREHNILSHKQFDAIDWKSVHNTLHNLPRLFQLWASEHVLGIAGTMKFLSHQDRQSPLCPSCHKCNETCKHIACCPEAGQAAAFLQSTNEAEKWMDGTGTHPDVKLLLL
jgi:hypothetical protein